MKGWKGKKEIFIVENKKIRECMRETVKEKGIDEVFICLIVQNQISN